MESRRRGGERSAGTDSRRREGGEPRSGAAAADPATEKHAADERLFRRLWDRHHELVRRYLEQRCAPEATEDLVQEVFLRVWLSRHRPLDEERMVGFLIRVARNLWIDHLRWQRNWGDVVPLEEAVLRSEYPERELTARLRHHSVREALPKLSPRRRAVFELRWLGGCSHREIAERLQISIKTVENHLTAATNELRELLREPRANGGNARAMEAVPGESS